MNPHLSQIRETLYDGIPALSVLLIGMVIVYSAISISSHHVLGTIPASLFSAQTAGVAYKLELDSEETQLFSLYQNAPISSFAILIIWYLYSIIVVGFVIS